LREIADRPIIIFFAGLLISLLCLRLLLLLFRPFSEKTPE
jgi:hypothetical protein